MAEWFLDPEVNEDQLLLSSEESHHCIRVKRNKVGDTISIANGDGVIFFCRISDIINKRVKVEILDSKNQSPLKPLLHLVVAPPKSQDKVEIIAEKSTEMGVSSIRFIQSEFSERNKVNIERLMKKVISACKQSNNPFIPTIYPIVKLKSFLEKDLFNQTVFYGDQSGSSEISVNKVQDKSEVTLLIGPEGGFSQKELDLFISNNFTAIKSGPYIQRTETACLSCLSILRNLF